ncbi:MAG: DUF3553 domain-containing protein [Acidobacteria bacterium]|nr:DUF3553 domain-containing protein [Acidobacteriota bacterium]
MASKPPFAQGTSIEHLKFGLGSVQSCTEEHIVVKFDEHGEKKFVLSIALPSLKKSDKQAASATKGRRKTTKATTAAVAN